MTAEPAPFAHSHILLILPGISGQVIEGTILDPPTPPRMSHGIHGPLPTHLLSCLPPPPRGLPGVAHCTDETGQGIPWPFTPGVACVAMASDFRDGGAFLPDGIVQLWLELYRVDHKRRCRAGGKTGKHIGRIVLGGGHAEHANSHCACHGEPAPPTRTVVGRQLSSGQAIACGKGGAGRRVSRRP